MGSWIVATVQGRVFMTHPTKAVYSMLLRDFAKLTRAHSDDGALYTEKDVDASLEKIEVVDFHQTITVNGIQVTPPAPPHLTCMCRFPSPTSWDPAVLLERCVPAAVN